MDPKDVLKQYFGYTAFRAGQEALVTAQLSGRDAFGVMPTGGGKSLCYQLPALMMDGITLVISPLISLMKDQVLALKHVGVAAAFINSSLSPEQIRLVYRRMREGAYTIVYVAPERLLTDSFLRVVTELRVAMVTVDEAHCISQWGQDFRPSYLKIIEFLKALPTRPIVSAFTATATERVQEDVVRLLGMRDPLRVVTGFDRPNLRFDVKTPKSKSAALQEFVSERADRCGIVYCSTRKAVEQVCEMLQNAHYGATRYHAGLPEEERHHNQEEFVYDRAKIMVATNAFGMGIDKSNVSYVVHYNMPDSPEAYYQEAGRAGRDGTDAECVLFYAAKDVQTIRYFIDHPSENEELTEAERRRVRERALERLDVMVRYCKTSRCLRGYLLNYFGQKHKASCGNCGNCTAEITIKDITNEAKMILSCVKRIENHMGYPMGETIVARVLHGSRDRRITDVGLDTVSTYGLMSTVPYAEVRLMLSHMMEKGYVVLNEHCAVELTEAAKEVLFRGKPVTMRVRKERAPKPRKASHSGAADAQLYTVLKALRAKTAAAQGVPAYVIFSNATLEDMAAKAPVSMEEFLLVSGVGETKANRFGKAFIKAIKEYRMHNR